MFLEKSCLNLGTCRCEDVKVVLHLLADDLTLGYAVDLDILTVDGDVVASLCYALEGVGLGLVGNALHVHGLVGADDLGQVTGEVSLLLYLDVLVVLVEEHVRRLGGLHLVSEHDLWLQRRADHDAHDHLKHELV